MLIKHAIIYQMKSSIFCVCLFFFISLTSAQTLVVLGTTQDAGKPQIGCQKSCCKNLKSRFFVASLGVSDIKNKKNYLFDATPDITPQFQLLSGLTGLKSIDGIFLTHAHSGHYTGLMYLGKEGMNGNKIPVYAMPRFTNYLTNNGPWSQLVTLENINLMPLQSLVPITLDNGLVVMPIVVPHRDEYSETVGFKIIGTKKSALYIPDIDKWKLWEKDIIAEVQAVDYAFIDGLHTFEQVTKDVINTLNATKAGSWIGIHDLIPLNWIEEHVPGYPEHHWTGDVWKVIYFIKGLKGIEFNIVLIDHGVGLIKKTSDTIFFPNFPYHLQKLTYNDFIKDYNNLPIISWDDAVKWIKNK